MFVLPFLSIALAVAASSALVIPRKAPPPGWLQNLLEPYDQYHARYLAIDCEAKHNTTFFANCCHPMLKTQTLQKDRLPECRPGSTSHPSTHAVDEGDTGCDDGDDTTTTEQAKTSAKTTAHPTSIRVATTTKASSTHVATTSSTQAAATHSKSAASNSGSSNSGSSPILGGFATFFFQNGVAGACGTVHSDNDLIAAIDADRYGNTGVTSPLCGRKVVITNQQNKKTVTVTIVDACPTCNNGNSIDLSVAAFKAIADESTGIVPIAWQFA